MVLWGKIKHRKGDEEYGGRDCYFIYKEKNPFTKRTFHPGRGNSIYKVHEVETCSVYEKNSKKQLEWNGVFWDLSHGDRQGPNHRCLTSH